MNFIEKIFGKKKDEPINTNADFWNWFIKNEKDFYKIVKQDTNIEKGFFDKLSPKLDELKEGYFFLSGMFDKNTVELIITPDGDVKNVVFVEVLIASAPKIDNWKFTALKPTLDIKDVSINMSGLKFNEEKLSFYANNNPEFPDEIDITIIHSDQNSENRSAIINGVYIFLDNYLGELNFLEIIDNLDFQESKDAEQDLIPIGKLKDYITWRQKEFIEKYDGIRTNSDKDLCSILQATLKNGRKLIATINTDLITWDRKASHPWMLNIEIKYDGESNNGMPDDSTYEKLNNLEEELLEELKDKEGYLYIGRQTADNLREIYFACNDFRKPSTVAYSLQQKYKDSEEIEYDIFKDKYWKSLRRFDVS
ncbi:DUF695 domain-containing protein [Flammeovirga yaeyamensis]|uniref:DUF695 domain-containing protein n=1 Tax=Flammeovirga yaeyamensis TaxID=367791 RepID=A0AAX1NDE9_9BACT|nr:DUF695 domain-containing protein [Flammeovirga yaeyamensis]MBB3696504.1 hypothetical protein [Flammeovirga yaeyamensis]NMF33184.1 DUF695 domain-containing protein [Flammeovirga yaeyamensis]QWG05536.1 DUF695 domain-containing protein [Flammeovirga yaeyamensis]